MKVHNSTFETAFLLMMRAEVGPWFDPTRPEVIRGEPSKLTGYVNHKLDPGGETKFGISKRSYPNLDIRSLTLEQAKEIYYNDYWLKARCDKISDISQCIAIAHFDWVVNSGLRTPSKKLQEVVGATADGVIGPKTLEALKQAINRSSENEVLHLYLKQRRNFYHQLVEKKPKLKVFLKGWLRRVDTLEYHLQC